MDVRTVLEFHPDPIHERRLVSSNERVRLWFYPELRIVHHQMIKPPSSEAFRVLLTKGAELVSNFKAEKWLSDDRGNHLVRPSDEEWADTVWLPRVLASGFRFWAIVPPPAAIGKLNMRRLAAQHAEHGVVCKIVGSPSEAFDWLKEQ